MPFKFTAVSAAGQQACRGNCLTASCYVQISPMAQRAALSFFLTRRIATVPKPHTPCHALRRDARERGIVLPDPPGDPNGDHLVVPYNRLAALRAAIPGFEGPVQPPAASAANAHAAAAGGDSAQGLVASLGLPGPRFNVPPPARGGEEGEEAAAGKAAQSAVAKELLQRSMARGTRGKTPPPAPSAGMGLALPQPAFKDASGGQQQQQQQTGYEAKLQEYQWQHPQQQQVGAGGAGTPPRAPATPRATVPAASAGAPLVAAGGIQEAMLPPPRYQS